MIWNQFEQQQQKYMPVQHRSFILNFTDPDVKFDQMLQLTLSFSFAHRLVGMFYFLSKYFFFNALV